MPDPSAAIGRTMPERSAATTEREGEVTYSVQWRCPKMAEHDRRPFPLPVPCSECYSLHVVTTVIPYRERVPWTTEPISV